MPTSLDNTTKERMRSFMLNALACNRVSTPIFLRKTFSNRQSHCLASWFFAKSFHFLEIFASIAKILDFLEDIKLLAKILATIVANRFEIFLRLLGKTSKKYCFSWEVEQENSCTKFVISLINCSFH